MEEAREETQIITFEWIHIHDHEYDIINDFW